MSFIRRMRGGGFTFVLTDTDATQNDTNSPSFANMDAGDVHSTRVLTAAFSCFDGDLATSVTWPPTCTIGGVSADKRSFLTSSGAGQTSAGAIYSAVVPNGTTATVEITITFSGTMDDWICALFRSTGVDEVPVATGNATSGGVDLDTRSAKFVVVTASDRLEDPVGSFSGGGNIVDAIIHNKLVIAYDNSPLGGNPDNYDTATTANAYVGAAFG